MLKTHMLLVLFVYNTRTCTRCGKNMQVSAAETLANIAGTQDGHASHINDVQMCIISDAEEAWIAAWNAQFDSLDAEKLQVKFGDLLNHMMPDLVRTRSETRMVRYPIHTGEHDFSHLSPVHAYFDQPVRLTLNKEPKYTSTFLTQDQDGDDSDSMGSVDSDDDANSDAASENGSDAASAVTLKIEEEYYKHKHKIPIEIPADNSEYDANNEPLEYIFYIQCQKPAASVRTTEAQQQCMRRADFQHFFELVRLAVAAHRTALVLSAPHNNTQ